MTLSPDVIERIREASDIAAVVGDHVQLKRSGRTWKALCPFHKEKTPSFTVNPDRQIFKCFGCGIGGDVYQFLMEFEKLSFPEAVEFLANRAGIPLPRTSWERPQDESVYPVLEWAAGQYQKLLWGPAGVPARCYLEERGLSEALIRRYGLGWAPDAWSTLLDAAGKTYTPELLSRAGLIITREQGGFYDRFRGRVMIPIRSALGKTHAFGARILGPGEPKYLNSPETEVFIKGKTLFGLSEAREALRSTGQTLVVEGYMDVLALVQAGFPNVIATCGTAFTSDQARVVRRYGDKVAILFDGDEAGVRATWKSAAIFLGEGLEVRIVSFPPEHDPDSFVRTEGAEALAEAIASAPGVVRFARDVLLERLEKRETLIKAFAYMGGRIDDPIRRRVLLQEAAEAFRFDEKLLASEARRLRGENPDAAPVRRATGSGRAPGSKGGSDPIARNYVATLLSVDSVVEEDLVTPETMRERRLQELYRAWLELREAGEPDARSRILEREDLREYATEILAEESGGAALGELVIRLREREWSREGRRLEDEIRQAEARGDADSVDALSRELKTLHEQRRGNPPVGSGGSRRTG